jgi:predicted Zn-dependent protease
MALQPTQDSLSTRREQSGREWEPVWGHRPRRIWLVSIGLALAVLVLGTWGYRAMRGQRSSPDAVWAQAEADLQSGRFEQVEKAVDRLSRSREPTPLDWLLRAQLAMARNQPDQALADLSRVPDHHYMAAQARLMAGQLELRRDRLRYAEAALLTALRLDPKLIQAHRELIFIYGMQLRRPELNREFHALSSLTNLKFEEAWHWCLLRNDSWEASEVVPVLARFVAADPGDRWSRLALSENDRRMGLVDDAESALAGLTADDPEAIAARARIAFDRNDEDRAGRLLASGPADDPALARLRGRLALSRRDAREALQHFRKAYAADPESRETLSGLVSALVLLGEERAAAPLREIAKKLANLSSLVQRAGTTGNRDDPQLPRQLGDACAALHRDAEARTWYKLAIARDPLDSQAQRALFQLDAAAQEPRPTLPSP